MAKKANAWLNKEVIKTVTVEGARITYKTLSFGAQRRVQGACVTVNEKGEPKADFTLMGVMQTVEAIMDWDVTDEEGNKLPISVETFDELLNPDFATEIIAVVSEQVTSKVDVEKKKK